MAADKRKIIVDVEQGEVSAKVLAESIVALSKASTALLAAGLNKRALVVLLKDATAVPFSDIHKVLDALPELARMYTRQR